MRRSPWPEPLARPSQVSDLADRVLWQLELPNFPELPLLPTLPTNSLFFSVINDTSCQNKKMYLQDITTRGEFTKKNTNRTFIIPGWKIQT